MILEGSSINSESALDAGLIDMISGEDLVADSISFLKRCRAESARHLTNEMATCDAMDFSVERAKLSRRSRNFNALMAVVDCIEKACSLSLKEGMEYERKVFRAWWRVPSHARCDIFSLPRRKRQKCPAHLGRRLRISLQSQF